MVLLNHTLQINPNSHTNLSKLFNSHCSCVVDFVYLFSVPSSGKNNFSKILIDRTREEFIWSTVGNNEMSMSLNKSEIIAELKAVALDKTQNDQERARRVLFVLPGACTISDVIQLIGRFIEKAKSCRSQCFKAKEAAREWKHCSYRQSNFYELIPL